MVHKLDENFIMITSEGENYFSGMADYHYHEQIEFYFLLSGECNYFIGNKIYPVTEGQIVLIPASMIHKTIYNQQKRDRIVLSVKKDFAKHVMFEKYIDFTKPSIFHIAENDRRDVEHILDKICVELKNKDELSGDVCRCLYFELLTIISRRGEDISSKIQRSRSISDEGAVIEKITQYITEHYKEEITLQSAAEKVNLSGGYLSKLFKRVTGLCFKEYLITVRILNAKHMLKETDYPVSRIAYECGFNDSNYFSKIFSEYSDITPLKYRKEHKKGQ